MTETNPADEGGKEASGEDENENKQKEGKQCEWTDNKCFPEEPEELIKKCFEHFCLNHENVMDSLKGLKEATGNNEELLDKFGRCNDAYLMIQLLTFIYKENPQFKHIVDEFNEKVKSADNEDLQNLFKEYTEVTKEPPRNVCTSQDVPNDVPDNIDICNEFGTSKKNVTCENPFCEVKPKQKKCVVFKEESYDSLEEKQDDALLAIQKHFTCRSQSSCKKQKCYPCNFFVNPEAIRKCVEEFVKSKEQDNEDGDESQPKPENESADTTCACENFRQYFLDKERNQKDEQEKQQALDKAIKNCACAVCPARDDAKGEPKGVFCRLPCAEKPVEVPDFSCKGPCAEDEEEKAAGQTESENKPAEDDKEQTKENDAEEKEQEPKTEE